MNIGIFNKFTSFDLLFDGIYRSKIVMYSILFTLTWLPRGMTDTELKIERIIINNRLESEIKKIQNYINCTYHVYTHTKFVSGKLFLQKLNQGPLTDTGGTTNNYGAASAGHGGVGVSKHYAKEGRFGFWIFRNGTIKMRQICTPHHTNMLAGKLACRQVSLMLSVELPFHRMIVNAREMMRKIAHTF